MRSPTLATTTCHTSPHLEQMASMSAPTAALIPLFSGVAWRPASCYVAYMELAFDERGLVPAVAVDATSGAVLMLAWMNAEALAATRATGEAHFYSRSRGRLWKKGETSGHTLAVHEVRVD